MSTYPAGSTDDVGLGEEVTAAGPARLLHTWNIPGTGSEMSLTLEARVGQVTTIVGANGAGKSALGAWLDRDGGPVTHRISAHRHLMIAASGSDMTSASRAQYAGYVESWRRELDAHYVDRVGAQSVGMVLFDLMGAITFDHKVRVDRYEGAEQTRDVVRGALGPTPLEKLNEVLASGGLQVRLDLGQRQDFITERVDSAASYPLPQMSDGEKSAVLLAAEVLAAQPGTVQIIDEPERHLHRAISTQVIRAVVASRPDCHFILLTHDLDLAGEQAHQPGQVLVLTSARWSSQEANGWVLHPLPSGAALPNAARTAILGGRTRLVFIEGKNSSIDLDLYRVLYPDCQFITMGGSGEVMRAVKGLNATGDHHWVQASGIVDGDHRNSTEVEALRKAHVAALAVAEVENLYYLDAVMEAVARAHLSSLGRDDVAALAEARTKGLAVLSAAVEGLVVGLARTAITRRVNEHASQKMDPTRAHFEVTVPSPYPEIMSEVERHVQAKNLSELVRLLPVRNTGFPNTIARALSFQTEADYRGAARVQMKQNPTLAEVVRSHIKLPL